MSSPIDRFSPATEISAGAPGGRQKLADLGSLHLSPENLFRRDDSLLEEIPGILEDGLGADHSLFGVDQGGSRFENLEIGLTDAEFGRLDRSPILQLGDLDFLNRLPMFGDLPTELVDIPAQLGLGDIEILRARAEPSNRQNRESVMSPGESGRR